MKHAATRFAGKIKRRLNRYRRTVLRSWYARGSFRMASLHGHVLPESIPVVMALWSRPERARAFFNELNAQELDRPIRLILWNNAPGNADRYRQDASSLAPGAIASIEMRTSRTNFGGIARFFIVARLRRQRYDGPVVMLDDDQIIDRTFVNELVNRYRPKAISGVWAFTQRGTYWGRDEVADGNEATYVGTGGCVVDPEIVDLDGFWRIPDRFSFIEDQWMSYIARRTGWVLLKADIPVDFVLQERNQHTGLHDLKEEFFRYLYDGRPDLEPR